MNSEAGYTYVSLLLAVFLVGTLAQVAWIPEGTNRQRELEAETLFRGLAYKRAIESYFHAGGENQQFPRSLDALVKDPRDPTLRHIRRLYSNPLGEGWTIVRSSDGGIGGVAPNSRKAPVKRANFPHGLEKFGQSESYSSWKFEFLPEITSN